MARRADRHVAEVEDVRRPLGERQLPRQLDEVDRRVAEAEPWERQRSEAGCGAATGRRADRSAPAQSRLRR